MKQNKSEKLLSFDDGDTPTTPKITAPPVNSFSNSASTDLLGFDSSPAPNSSPSAAFISPVADPFGFGGLSSQPVPTIPMTNSIPRTMSGGTMNTNSVQSQGAMQGGLRPMGQSLPSVMGNQGTIGGGPMGGSRPVGMMGGMQSNGARSAPINQGGYGSSAAPGGFDAFSGLGSVPGSGGSQQQYKKK